MAWVTVDKALELGLKPEVWTKPALQPKEPEKLAAKSDQIVANGSPPSPQIDAIRGKIDNARMVQQTFGGLKYCSELNGTSFYFPQRDRIFNLEEYSRSLESLVKTGSYNQPKRRVWTPEDAKEREEAVKRLAQEDKRKCELVLSLPELEKRLQELQAAAAKKD
jgi:hypothetical protein